jgi:hypothetical protein
LLFNPVDLENVTDRLTQALKNKTKFAFISSLLHEFEQRGNFYDLAKIRKQIADLNKSLISDRLPAYIDEVYHNINVVPDENGLASVLRFNNLIRDSEFVIFLLAKTERVGSSVHFEIDNFDHPSPVGFWEFEIFTVAISRKKFFIVVEEGFSTDKELSQVLTIFQNCLPHEIHIYPKNEFADVVAEILATQRYPDVKEGNLISGETFDRQVNFYRYKLKLISTVKESLLSPFVKKQGMLPDKDLIGHILSGTEHESEDFEKQLIELYMAYRSLLRANYFEKGFQDYLEYWHLFIDQWHRVSRFCGLHGRMSLSGLNLLHDALEIRPRLKAVNSKFKDFDDEHYTHVQLAGSYYASYSLTRQKADKMMLKKVMNTKGTSMSYANVLGNLHMIEGNYKAAIVAFKDWLVFLKERKDTGEGLFLGESMLKLAYVKSGRKEYVRDLEVMAHRQLNDSGAGVQLLFRAAQANQGDQQAMLEWLAKAEQMAKTLKAWDQYNKIHAYIIE